MDREEEREGGGEALGVLQLAVCMHAHASERGYLLTYIIHSGVSFSKFSPSL